ncbi:MAG: orotate phosphoribosyltransferase [Thermoplasmatota archaeon]
MLIEQLMECGALRFGDFTLTSGKKSRYYVDIKKASSRPEILREITRSFIDFGLQCDKVAGMELGAVALIVSYSLQTGKRFVIIRKGEREHGTRRKIEGEILPGERILLLEDVVTSGGSVMEAIDRIEEAGGKVIGVLCVVDRREGGTERVMERALFKSLVTAEELLEKSQSI